MLHRNRDHFFGGAHSGGHPDFAAASCGSAYAGGDYCRILQLYFGDYLVYHRDVRLQSVRRTDARHREQRDAAGLSGGLFACQYCA